MVEHDTANNFERPRILFLSDSSGESDKLTFMLQCSSAIESANHDSSINSELLSEPVAGDRPLFIQ